MSSKKSLAGKKTNNPLRSEIAGLAFFAVSYWTMVRLGLLLAAQPEGIASIWPASGLALAIFLLIPRQRWLRLAAIIFFTNAAGNYWSGGNPLLVSLGFALANTLEAFLGAWSLEYFCKSKITFERAREVVVLFGVAILSNGVTALLGAAVSALAFAAPFAHSWLVWWVADGLGMLLVAPVIVCWANNQDLTQIFSVRKLPEAMLLVFILALFAFLLFGPFTHAERPFLRNYMLFPLLIWLAFRFTPREMANALLVFAVIAVWNTLQGYGIFSFANQSRTEVLISLQMYLSVAVFSGLLLSAMVAERRQTEEVLRLAEAQYRSIFEDAPVGIFQSSPHGNFLNVNPTMAKIYGYNSAQEMISSIRDISRQIYVDQAERERFQNILLERGEISEYVANNYRKDGTRIWTQTNARAEKDAQGKILRYEGFITDITGRRQFEAVLQASEENFRNLAENSLEGILIATENGRHVYANHRAADLLGYSPEEILQTMQKDLADPAAYPILQKRLQDRIAGRPVPNNYETVVRRKDGTSFHADVTGARTVWQGQACDLVFFRDITERKQVEESLRASEEKYRTVANFTYDWEAWHAPYGVYLYVSPSCERITGYTAEEFILDANLIINITHPDDRANVINHFQATTHQSKQKDVEFDFRIITKSGEIRWINHTCTAVYGGDGKWLGRRESNHDITARKKSESVLRSRLWLSQFADTHSIDELLQNTLDEAESLTESRIGFFHGLDADQKTLTLQIWSTNTIQNMCTAEGKGQHYPIDQAGVWVDCVYAREPVTYNDYAGLPASRRKGLPEGHVPVSRILVVPIIRNDLIVAIFGVGNKPTDYDEDNTRTVLQIADLVWDVVLRKRSEEEVLKTKEALVIANQELQTALEREKKLSHTDPLTGINNRRNLFELAAGAFDVAARHQLPLSVMMFDIDHFKKVNDTYGHDIGDQVLRRVVQAACAELRSSDVIGRYGGEEFVVILPVTTAQQAYPVAERIRASVEAVRVPTPKGDAAATLSIGIAEMIHAPKFPDGEIESLDNLIRRADEAMYAAKQAGRNCSAIFNRK